MFISGEVVQSKKVEEWEEGERDRNRFRNDLDDDPIAVVVSCCNSRKTGSAFAFAEHQECTCGQGRCALSSTWLFCVHSNNSQLKRGRRHASPAGRPTTTTAKDDRP